MAISTSCPGFEEILERRFCLENLSKDAEGKLIRTFKDHQECRDPRCITFKTIHALEMEVKSGPCDSSLGKLFDGAFIVEKLATAFIRDGEQRGCHTGEFLWKGDDTVVRGEITGTTNAGTHRKPVFDPCQKCHAPGYMEGVFCGHVIETAHRELHECQIKGSYRFRFDHSIEAQDTGIRGVFEGLVICPCRR